MSSTPPPSKVLSPYTPFAQAGTPEQGSMQVPLGHNAATPRSSRAGIEALADAERAARPSPIKRHPAHLYLKVEPKNAAFIKPSAAARHAIYLISGTATGGKKEHYIGQTNNIKRRLASYNREARAILTGKKFKGRKVIASLGKGLSNYTFQVIDLIGTTDSRLGKKLATKENLQNLCNSVERAWIKAMKESYSEKRHLNVLAGTGVAQSDLPKKKLVF